MNKIRKSCLIILISTLLILFIFFFFYRSIIFQEGNPWPIFKAIMKLNFSSADYVKIINDSEEVINNEKYLTKSKNGREIIISKLALEDYRLTEQMGAGYFFIKDNFDRLIVTHKHYSRFYSIWKITKKENVRDSIDWLEYRNEEYGFSFKYPSVSISNMFWGNIGETISVFDLLLPNQVLNKNNNFYFTQKYNVKIDYQKGELIKNENTFVPEYSNKDNSYPLPWHIVILSAEDEKELDKRIKEKLGSGCSFTGKITTAYENNYRVEIIGDGRDLSETLCPVNYANYIIYSPTAKKVAFWSMGQECQTGLGFMANNCFDLEIAESFHFINN